MVWLKAILLMGIIWINGCAWHKAVAQKRVQPMTMMDIYAQSTGDAQKDMAKFIENNLKEQKTFGYVKPYIPVMNEPVVRKVWIPDHKSEEDADVMIAGHWSYVMIQPPTWFIDEKKIDARLPIVVPLATSSAKTPELRKEKKDYGNYNSTDGEDI